MSGQGGQPAAPKAAPDLATIAMRLLGWSVLAVPFPMFGLGMVVACPLIDRRSWRPWWFVAGGAGVLVVELAVWGPGLLAFHVAGVPDMVRTFADPAKVGATAATARLWAHTLPLSFPVGLIVGGWWSSAQERAGRGAPWHPGTIRKRAREDQATRRKVRRLLRRPDDSECSGPALGVAGAGHLPDWTQGPYVVPPAALRGRSLAIAGVPGSGKTVLLRRMVANDGARGRRSIVVDGKATEPGLADELAAAWQAGSGLVPTVRRWPAEPLDGWRGEGRELANRLLSGQRWSEEWYHRLASRTVRKACQAPGGPPRSADDFLRRLDGAALVELYAGTDEQGRVERLTKERGFAGVELRFSDYFDALEGRFDGGWSYGDADVAVLSLPTLAAREDAAAAFAFLLQDLLWWATQVKARTGDDVTVYLDEFSAVSDGADHAYDLAERLRDVGVGVVFVGQSWEGFGPPGSRERILASCTARMVLAMPDPEPFIGAGGTFWTPEQSWSLDQAGPTGQASLRMERRRLVDPDRVRRFEVGQVAIIAGGQAVEAYVLPPDAAAPLAAAEGPLAAAAGWEVRRPARTAERALERLDGSRLSLPRVRLQLAAAVRAGDRAAAAELAPLAGLELVELTRWARWRRRWPRPAVARWLHRRRVRS